MAKPFEPIVPEKTDTPASDADSKIRQEELDIKRQELALSRVKWHTETIHKAVETAYCIVNMSRRNDDNEGWKNQSLDANLVTEAEKLLLKYLRSADEKILED